jgi:glycosyltransferase involved in cell wall biosynthesis
MENKNVTIIIPAFNEEKAIKDTLDKLIPFAKKNNWEIVVVNDGSSDKTKEIVEKMESITLLNHPHNKGYGAALKTGMKYSNTELVAFYDSDGQHNPEDLERLVENFGNYDMLVGQRGKDSHQDWIRKPGKFVLSKVANYLAERKIPDLNSGLRVIRRDIIIHLLHLLPNKFSLTTTSTIAMINLGYNVGYSPIRVNKRIGKSTVKQFKHGTGVILLILRLIILFNPLKIFIRASVYLFLIGLAYEVAYGIILNPDGVSLIPGALFIMVTSILIFFFGLVVDQISELRKHLYLNEK